MKCVVLKSNHHHHQSLNREGRWGTTDNFATSFLHFPLFSTALWDFVNSRPVHSLMLSSHLFLCPPCLLPPFTVPCKMVLAKLDERETKSKCIAQNIFITRWWSSLSVIIDTAWIDTVYDWATVFATRHVGSVCLVTSFIQQEIYLKEKTGRRSLGQPAGTESLPSQPTN